MFDPMTEEQVEHYRKVLAGMIGPYALLMSAAEIQAHRDAMQRTVNAHATGGQG